MSKTLEELMQIAGEGLAEWGPTGYTNKALESALRELIADVDNYRGLARDLGSLFIITRGSGFESVDVLTARVIEAEATLEEAYRHHGLVLPDKHHLTAAERAAIDAQRGDDASAGLGHAGNAAH